MRRLIALLAAASAVAGFGVTNVAFAEPGALTTAFTTQEAPTTSVPASPFTECPSGSFEGYFKSIEQMRQYYICSIPIVESFFYATYGPEWQPPDAYNIILDDDTLGHNCAGEDASDMAYFYCSGDQQVYIGAQAMWIDYTSEMEDIAHFGSLAHEVGHHLQYLYIPYNPNETQAEGIAAENQADCVMGAAVRYWHDRGWLEWEDDKLNLQELIEYLASRLAIDDPTRTHGTLEERANSFNTGHEFGIESCNGIPNAKPIFGVPVGTWVAEDNASAG
jgi:predicted metalloprotease